MSLTFLNIDDIVINFNTSSVICLLAQIIKEFSTMFLNSIWMDINNASMAISRPTDGWIEEAHHVLKPVSMQLCHLRWHSPWRHRPNFLILGPLC